MRGRLEIDALIAALDGRTTLTEAEAKDVLRAFEIPTTQPTVITAPDALDGIEIQYPAVAKICSPKILHKSDRGGVKLGIQSPDELKAAVDDLFARFDHEPVLIEQQEEPGTEMIMGLIHDQTFGPSIMVGFGGILTEVYQDVAFRVVPITRYDAAQMLAELRAHVLFDGFRGQTLDRDAVLDMLLKLSALSEAFGGKIGQMDLNPVFVRARGAIVVDAKMILKPQPEPESD